MAQRQKSAFEAVVPLRIDLGLGGGLMDSASVSGGGDSPEYDFDRDSDGPQGVLESDFYPRMGENVKYKRASAVVGLLGGEMVMVKGQYRVKCISGSVTIDGVAIGGEGIDVNAATITSLPVIRVTKEDDCHEHAELEGVYSAILEFTNNDVGLADVGNVLAALKYVFATNSSQYSFKIITSPEANTYGNSVSSSWQNALNSLDPSRPHKVLILGNKGSGKSTLGKMVLNSLLTSNSAKKVQVLDLDPGQPEFTYPLTLSLSTLSKPVFGTVVPDLLDFDSHNVEFYGFNTPAVSPLGYFRHLGKLIKHDNPGLSTVINAPGWTKGFGVDVVRFVLERCLLTDIFVLNEASRGLDLLREIEFPEGVRVRHLPAFLPDERITNNPVTAAKTRTFKILAPLHKTDNKFDFSPLLEKSPLQVSYFQGPKSGMSSFGGVSFVTVLDSEGISSEDLCECLEAQMVGLHTINGSDLRKSVDSASSSGGLPFLVPESVFQGLDAHFEAYGCVHSVDKHSHKINLYLSQLPQDLNERVQKGAKLIIVAGRNLLPTEELQWRKWAHPVPYSAPGVSGVPGAKPVVIRRTVQRGRLY